MERGALCRRLAQVGARLGRRSFGGPAGRLDLPRGSLQMSRLLLYVARVTSCRGNQSFRCLCVWCIRGGEEKTRGESGYG